MQKGLKPYDPKDFAYLQDVVLKECSTKTPTTTSERSSKVPMHMAPYPVHLEQNNQYQGNFIAIFLKCSNSNKIFDNIR